MTRETKHTVLIVDDDPQIRKMLLSVLDSEGFKVVDCENGKTATRLSASVKPDIVLLDLDLPDMNGREVVKALRQWSQAPIIVVSGRSADTDMIELLTLGADDYVVKPFNFDLLLARMGAHLRKSAVRDAGEPELTNGELRMDLVRHEVFLRGEKVSFTPKEYALLRYFMVNRGKMLTHKDILREVWGKAHAEDTQYLRTFIGQIRDKIEKDPANPSIILTEPGIGYRMETAA
ncbi:MAG TPA: response regulator transcription factor [Patescibacteria group bacterium]|nr:response regulator transcription factor [Patescibacteria group bacterium]